MDGDMNDIFQKLNTMLQDKETSENLKNIISNFSSSNSQSSSEDSSNSHSTENQDTNRTSQGMPEFDINTILKMKSIMDSLNNTENDARSNLLLSLKPYLAESKKDKIDQYVKFLHFAKVIEILNPMGGDTAKNE